jgi:hypothetical protein
MMAVMTLAAVAQTKSVKESSSASSMTTTASNGTDSLVKDDLFAGTEVFAKGATDVNEITMDPGTLGMVDGSNKAKAHRTVLSVVRTYGYDKPGMYRIEDVESFRNKLNTGDWHCSVHTRNMKTGESTDVCNRQRSDDLKETAIITVEPKQLTFIHTIRRSSGEGGYAGSSYMMVPGSIGGMDPAMRAEMAISMAEMHAQMAEMRAMQPGMMGVLGNVDLSDLNLQLKKMPKMEGKQLFESKKSEKLGAEKQPE